jgi:hypothetical protein
VLFDDTKTVQELLRGPERRLMQFFQTVNQAKTPSEFVMQRIGIITFDIQPAAFHWSFRPKCTDNNVAPGFNSLGNSLHVGSSLRRGRQEVKHGAVMPDVIGMCGENGLRHIRHNPRNLVRNAAKPCLRDIDRGLRDVKNRQIVVAVCQQIVDKRGFASTNVDDPRRMIVCRAIDQR